MVNRKFTGVLLAISLLTPAGMVQSDDTDIFLGKDSAGARGIESSNLFFMLDTSGSMLGRPATDTTTTDTKIEILQDAMTDILSLQAEEDDTLRNINVGIGTFYEPGGIVAYPMRPIDDPGINGGTVRNEIIGLINNLVPPRGALTPLVSSYYESLSYILAKPVLFGVQDDDFRNLIADGRRLAQASHPQSFNPDVPPTYNYDGIVDQVCASNSILLLSDGQATQNPYTQLRENDPVLMNALPVDATDGLPCDASWGNAERCGRELADYAFTRGDSTNPDVPPIFTHTIGFGISADSRAEAYLQDVSEAGGGQYFRAENKDQLVEAFLNITNRVAETTSAFSAPVVPGNSSNELFSSSEVYLNLFSTERKPIWAGNVKKFEVCLPEDDGCTTGQYIGTDGQPATDDDGNLLFNGVGDLWDDSGSPSAASVMSGGAASKIVDWTERNIYTWTGADYPINVDTNNNSSARGWDLYRIDPTREIPASGAEPNLADTNDIVGSDGRLRKRLVQAHGLCDAAGSIDSACMDDLIQYLLGAKTRDTQDDGPVPGNRWPLTDVMHSEILAIPYGSTASGEQISKIVFGTNDGGLHVHDSVTGLEHFTIYPQELLNELGNLESADEGSRHIYGLDGSSSIRIRDVDSDSVIEPEDGDFVHLYIGMRRGGYNYYAFNLTPDSTLTDHGDAIGDPELLWVIRGTEDVNDPFYRLGQTWSSPEYTRILFNNGTGTESKSVLIFGGGYDPDVEDVEGSFGPVAPSTSNLGNAIYIVDADTGEPLWWSSSDFSTAGGVPGLQPDDMVASIVGDINLVDSDSDRRTDRLYATDLMGQVWRVDLNPQLDQSSVGRLASLSAEGDPTDPADNADERKFFYKPDFVRLQDVRFSSGVDGDETYDVIALVSGNRANPIDSTTEDRLYVIRDYLDDELMQPAGSASPTNYPACNATGSGGCSTATSITNGGLVDLTSSIISNDDNPDTDATAAQLSQSNGYYFGLSNDGEIGFSATQVLAGKLYFTSYTPESGPSVREESVDGVVQCVVDLGTSSLYIVDVVTGSPATPSTTSPTPDQRAYQVGSQPITGIVPVILPTDSGGSEIEAVFQSGGSLPPDPDATELLFYPTFWYQQ